MAVTPKPSDAPRQQERHTLSGSTARPPSSRPQFDVALSDLESATAGPNLANVALIFKARALSELGRHRECCELLEMFCSGIPSNNTAVKARLERATKRLAEQTDGRYQFKQMHKEAAALRPPHLDHATHIGPVQAKASGFRGRGLFTTKAVKAGGLLFVKRHSPTRLPTRQELISPR